MPPCLPACVPALFLTLQGSEVQASAARGGKAGVFVGVSSMDYNKLSLRYAACA